MQNNFKKKKEQKITIKDKDTGYDKKVVVKQYQLPNGIVENFFTDDDGHSVQILPITKNNEIYLVKQWRPGIEKEQFELPGGGLNKNEDIKLAAKRELEEETSLITDNIVHLASLNYSPYSSGVRHMFLATDCVETGNIDLDPNEFLKVYKFSVDDIRELIKKGQIRGFDTIYVGLDYLGML